MREQSFTFIVGTKPSHMHYASVDSYNVLAKFLNNISISMNLQMLTIYTSKYQLYKH
jgi:hypothetical protein